MGINLLTAQKHLDEWLKAELELTSHQSYRIGVRWLTKADLKEVRNQVKFWETKVSQLSRKGSNRTYRAVPRDI
ncbi:MAG: DUF6148 family protein [Oscillospiraceae bacterium]|nr:DUF6148 family protein [Oscillospiraceae bacterium]